jgi:hypothetical protein
MSAYRVIVAAATGFVAPLSWYAISPLFRCALPLLRDGTVANAGSIATPLTSERIPW